MAVHRLHTVGPEHAPHKVLSASGTVSGFGQNGTRCSTDSDMFKGCHAFLLPGADKMICSNTKAPHPGLWCAVMS